MESGLVWGWNSHIFHYFISFYFVLSLIMCNLCQSCDVSNPSPGLAKSFKPTQIGNLALVMSSTELIVTDRLLMKCGPDIYCKLLSQLCNLSI